MHGWGSLQLYPVVALLSVRAAPPYEGRLVAAVVVGLWAGCLQHLWRWTCSWSPSTKAGQAFKATGGHAVVSRLSTEPPSPLDVLWQVSSLSVQCSPACGPSWECWDIPGVDEGSPAAAAGLIACCAHVLM
jgi:hypothetical protein